MADDLPGHISRLMSARDIGQAVTRALYRGGRIIEQHAELSITQGSVSGKHHVPSLPGHPPMRDTGVLDSNIETRIETSNPPEVHVVSKAEYAAHLEFGTSKMAARPYMRPAAQARSGEVAQMVGAAVSAELKRIFR